MVQWLRMQELGMEVVGLSSGYDQLIFFRHFLCTFLPPVTVLLEYLSPQFYTCSGFAL